MATGSAPELPASVGGGGERVAYLDNLKVVLTAGVIVAHAAMSYGAVGTWVYEERSVSGPVRGLVGAVVGAGAMFGLGLFYLVAGMLTAAPMRRRGSWPFVRSRLRRLGLPLVAYALVIWPVLRWWVARVDGDPVSLPSFYRFELVHRWRSAGTGPLWFVAVLLAATTAWAVWRRLVPPAADPGPLELRHLAMAAAVIGVATFVVRLAFPLDSAQFLDIHVWLWPQAGTLFVLGAVGAERGWWSGLSLGLRRRCLGAVVGAGAVFGALVLVADGPDSFRGGWHLDAAGMAGFEGVVSVTMSMIVLDRFRRRHDRWRWSGQRLAAAAYGAFVAQGPVLVALALLLRPVDLTGDVKFLMVAVTAPAMSFVFGDLVARPRASAGGPTDSW